MPIEHVDQVDERALDVRQLFVGIGFTLGKLREDFVEPTRQE